MRRPIVKVCFAVLISGILAVIPLFDVKVVPEWSLHLIDEGGQPVSNVRVEQTWKDYSVEFWTVAQHYDYATSDASGLVTFPARNIQVSFFEIIAAKFRDTLASVDPHSSFGPKSFLLCREKTICNARYTPEEELPKFVIVRK